jgi:hypothetical protein
MSGLVRPMARGAGRQHRSIEGGGAEHQLSRRRATQLLVQLGFIHHHPHIGVEGSEVARPASVQQ